MKNNFYILFILLSFISCTNKEKSFVEENLVEINLIFTDFNQNEHKWFIDIQIENSIFPIKKQLRISDSGTVNYNFVSSKTKEIVFKYEHNSITFIASPGESLIAELKISELSSSAKFKEFNVSGINKKTNSLILLNTFYVDSLIKLSTNAFVSDNSLSIMDYKSKRIAEMEAQLMAFEEYISKNKISDQLFINWSNSKIRYAAAFDLSLFPFMGKTNSELSSIHPYFNFINQVKTQDNDLSFYDSYIKFLKVLYTDFIIMSTISDEYKTERNTVEDESFFNYKLLFKIINDFPFERERELVMAIAFQDKKDLLPNKYSDSLKNIINEELLTFKFQFTPIENKTILELINEYELIAEEKEELLNIYEEIENKVIFHNFWFTNCAPCMEELPSFNELINQAGDDVVFIFFGAYMKEQDWVNTIKKYNLKGRHHLLSKNQIAFFELYFGLHGFPHHHIIDSNGIITNEDIPRALPLNFNKILSLLEKNKL